MIPHATGLDAPVSFHQLRAYGRSGMHGYQSRTSQAPMTGPMELGAAVDTMLFATQPVTFYPGSVRRGKEYEQFVAANEGSLILTRTDYAKAERMADAARTCAVAEPLLKGTFQKTILFRWMGLDCRATPDVIGDGFLTELKTSQTSDPVRFPWHSIRMAYHAQMRMQNIAIGDAAQDHYIVCVESAEPHPVTVFRIDEALLEQGEKLLVMWAEKLKQCESAREWPAYCETIVPIAVPEQEGDELIFAEDE